MQAVILAAGKSTRTYPLTVSRPKPLLKVCGKTLLEWNLDALTGTVKEVIIVIGYKKQMILDHYDNVIRAKYKSLKIEFVEQKEQLGTGHAVLQVKDKVKGKFILMMGDDVYSKADVEKCAAHKKCILARKVKDASKFGVLILDEKGKVKDMIEKPSIPVSNLANCALYVLDDSIFDKLEKLKKSERGEYEITDGLNKMFRDGYFDYEEAADWQPIGYPWDVISFMNTKLKSGEKFIGENCTIKGEVLHSSIGDNCVVGGKVVNSVLFDNVIVEEGSVVEDSVLGYGVKFKGIVKGEDDVKSLVKDKWAWVDRLGAVIGDNVTVNSAEIKAGVKIWPGKKVKGSVMGDVQ